jgi:hypothetical protein
MTVTPETGAWVDGRGWKCDHTSGAEGQRPGHRRRADGSPRTCQLGQGSRSTARTVMLAVPSTRTRQAVSGGIGPQPRAQGPACARVQELKPLVQRLRTSQLHTYRP